MKFSMGVRRKAGVSGVEEYPSLIVLWAGGKQNVIM